MWGGVWGLVYGGLEFLDILEVLVCADGEHVAGSLVADDDAMRVHLEDADSPHLRDSTFNGSLEGARLVMTVAQDKHLLGSHDSTGTDSESSSRHLVGIVVESSETAVGDACVGGERLLACACREAGAGLVEGDMSVGTDASEEEVDATSLYNHTLIVGTLCLQVRGIAIEDVDVLWGAVDVVEEVFCHERMVALGVVFGQTDILVHVESDDIPEADATFAVRLDKVAIHTLRRGASRETQHKGFGWAWVCLVDTFDYIVSCPG